MDNLDRKIDDLELSIRVMSGLKTSGIDTIGDLVKLTEGEFLRTVVKTSEDTYCAFGIWVDEEAMVAARPEMIIFLDTIRHLLSEISPELGVTDPVSGEVLFLDGIDWRSGTLHEYATELPDVDYNEPPESDD